MREVHGGEQHKDLNHGQTLNRGAIVRSLTNTYTIARTAILQLKDDLFIDRYTSAVSVDLTLYNANQNSIAIVRLFLELPPGVRAENQRIERMGWEGRGGVTEAISCRGPSILLLMSPSSQFLNFTLVNQRKRRRERGRRERRVESTGVEGKELRFCSNRRSKCSISCAGGICPWSSCVVVFQRNLQDVQSWDEGNDMMVDDE
eukprot:764092-Hanusia_phi.AAC.2